MKDRKHLWRHQSYVRIRYAVTGIQKHLAALKCRQVFERSVLLFPTKKVRKRGRGRRKLWLSVPQPNDAFGIIEGQRPQQHRIDYTENRGIRANTQSESYHRNGREARIFQKRADAAADSEEARTA